MPKYNAIYEGRLPKAIHNRVNKDRCHPDTWTVSVSIAQKLKRFIIWCVALKP